MDNKKDKNLRIAEYLDEIAKEATNIADIWEQSVYEISMHYQVDVHNINGGKALISAPPPMNQRPYSRLESFYFLVTNILNVDHNDKADPIVFHIAKILQERNLAKETVEEQLNKITEIHAFDNSNNINTLKSLSESVGAMHKEAAALHVLAKSFRASIR